MWVLSRYHGAMKQPIKKLCACGCGQEFFAYWQRNKKRYAEFILFHGVRKVPLGREVLDLAKPHYAYMFGMFQTDSHFRQTSRNRGALIVELGQIDRKILEKFKAQVPVKSYIKERCRDTNFKEDLHIK